ncbi:MAG: DUF4255 domain-containing protein [Clostridia bacterium]|nr:DUF4255 domain-containing protein [Clostridia bacterium]
MSYSAIEDVGNTLLKLLRENIPSRIIEDPEAAVGMVSPAEKTDFRLVVYLYHIEENYEMVQAGMSRTSREPVFLNLYYLIAANSQAEIKSRAQDNNRILGAVIGILHENSVLSGSMLEGSLAGGAQCIKVSIQNHEGHPFTSKIKEWGELIMKNILCYKVGPVSLGHGGTGEAGSRVL